MRPSAILVAGFLAALLPVSGHAQSGVRLGLGGGVTLPLRSYSDLVNRGWLGTANLTFFPGASASIGFRLDAIYARSTLNVASGRQSELGGLANLVFQFGARRSPNRVYVFGGGGYLRTRSTGPNFGTVSSTDPAWNAGAGVSFGGRALALYAEARYITVSTSGTKPQFAPIVAGVSFGGF
jgi:hypothetical protein